MTQTDTLLDPLHLLPHRYPLLLVDRITAVEPGLRATGIKTVTGNEWATDGSHHEPAARDMPHLLIVEALAQLSAAVLVTLVNVEHGAIGYFLGINAVRFRGRAAAGDVIHLTITLLSFRRGICKLRGVAHANGLDLVRADLTTIMKAAA